MKNVIIALLAIGLSFSTCLADETAAPKDRQEKESYALGYQFGQYLHSQNVDINLNVYTSAVKQALDGKESLLNREEIRMILNDLQQRISAARQKELRERAASPQTTP